MSWQRRTFFALLGLSLGAGFAHLVYGVFGLGAV